MYWKNIVLQDVPAKLRSSYFLVSRAMQVLFVLRFYHLDKRDKIHRLIHDSSSKIDVSVSRLVKKLMYEVKFELPLAMFTPGGGGESHMKQTGMHVGNFEFNP